MNKERSSFTGKIGFVLAAAGSAVGLGNIWRFPYLAAKYGGGIFLLVYLVLAVTFGFVLMIGEIALGRKTGQSAIEAFSSLSKKWKFLGVLTSCVPMLIFPYYCVIGGWVVKYLVTFIGAQGAAAAENGYFEAFIGQTGEPVLWLALFIVATAVIVLFGVEKGVEKASKVMMPILVVLSVIVAGYVVLMPGAGEGVLYYLKPDFSKFSTMTVLSAMGQLFYSMSLAMGIMITYGSYMKKEVKLESSVKQIEVFDFGIAFIAGLMIIPAVFAFNGGENLNAGPGLMFIMLPKVFGAMKFGSAVGALFFLLVLFAALTSAISLMETIVSIIQDQFHWNRRLTCIIVMLAAIAVGIPSSLGFGAWGNVKPLGMSILDFFDFLSNSVLMPIVAFLFCIFVGYVIKPETIVEEVEINGPFRRKRLFEVFMKYVAPIFIILILISSIANSLGWIVI
ncbi:sodium-dependent transporter [Lachnotalea sp. AF33-28]|uniref:sodium-dependent transporter n=1 Tax=Lachnotalea sp. AF33-28 TaxID=2292046 RepID=UPI000E4F90FB|nr:sodium-dependent transporter [Lachnotalea sp. AF33-28]RHP34877.1 sodium-dependent transporter [Lachnotalea sp. AF33-28]